MRIIVPFNLKPGVSVADYEKWAKETDLPVVNGLGSIRSFEVFRATGLLGSDAPAPYAYVEILDIADMDAFGKDVASETMQKVAAEFGALADPVFIMTETL